MRTTQLRSASLSLLLGLSVDHNGLSRALLLFSTTALIVLCLTLPVHADQFLLWENGDSFIIFDEPTDNIIIDTGAIEFVKRCSHGVDDVFFCSSDIYIISSTRLPLKGGVLDDVSGVPNTITGACELASEFIGNAGRIGNGIYAVVFDECQDGILGDEDFVLDPAFEIRLPVNPPGIDLALHAYKLEALDQAAKYLEMERQAQLLFTYIESIDPSFFEGIYNCLQGDIDACKSVIDFLIEAAQKKHDDGMKGAALAHVANMTNHYLAIYNDPPDPNFMTTTPLASIDFIEPSSEEPYAREAAAFGNAAAVDGSIAEALLRSIERYQGADQAEDGEWALVHARAIRDYALVLKDQVLRSNDPIGEYRDALNADPLDLDLAAQQLRILTDRFREEGFTLEELQALHNWGFSDVEIELFRNDLTEPDFSGYTRSASLDTLDALIAVNGEASAVLATMAGEVDAIIAQLIALGVIDNFPSADPGGPYIVPEGTPLALDGTGSSDPDGAILKWEWDLDGDAEFDDASGSTPVVVFDQSYDGLVGLRVTDDSGNSNIGYAPLLVTDVNFPPHVESFSPDSIPLEVEFGDGAMEFLVTATDPDGDPITIEWFVDDVSVGSGGTFLYEPGGSEDAGFHYIRADVSDVSSPRGGTIVQDWNVVVVFPDGDGDGYRENADCDDTDPNVNPAAREICDNAVDEDCDGDFCEYYVPIVTSVSSNTPNEWRVVPFREDVRIHWNFPSEFNGYDGSMPAFLIGADLIQGHLSDARDPNLELTLELSEPATVYFIVGFNGQFGPSEIPDWLEPLGFCPTGLSIGIDTECTFGPSGCNGIGVGAGVSINGATHIWVAEFPAGPLTLYDMGTAQNTTPYSIVVRAGHELDEFTDMSNWTQDRTNGGNWIPQCGGKFVLQTQNADMTFWSGGLDATNKEFEVVLRPQGNTYDYMGFALGYEPGEIFDDDAEYLLIDFRQRGKFFDFGAGACPEGTSALVGLAVSRVFGRPHHNEFWSHEDITDPSCPYLHANSGVEELARGFTLGSTGFWSDYEYRFRVRYTEDRLQIWVNDVLEFDLEGDFPPGGFAFYNFSEANVTYGLKVINAPEFGSIAGQVTAGCPTPGTPLEGVVVNAYQAGGIFVASVLTDANGDYSIEDLAAGDYAVEVVPPVGYGITTNNVAVTVSVGEVVNADFALLCNSPPQIESMSPETQAVQYSDWIAPVTIAATDDELPHESNLTLSSTWSRDGGTPEAGLPAGIMILPGDCAPSEEGVRGCAWTLAGQMLEPEGEIKVIVTVGDGVHTSEPDTMTIGVESEETRVAFPEDNHVAVQVVSPGGNSGSFTLGVIVTEFDDPDDVTGDANTAGNIDLAKVHTSLVPVGPGGTVTPVDVCVRSINEGHDDPDSPYGYSTLTVVCSFDDVPVNAYAVSVEINGEGYYTGTDESVVVIFDPSLGFATGGGWFRWPGTEDTETGYAGDRTNYGFNVKYTKNGNKTQGSLLLIRRLADGTFYRLKSNQMEGMSIGQSTDIAGDFGWASFLGKATYKEPDWVDPLGNYQFTAYIEDHGEPGADTDRFWLKVLDRDDQVTPDLSMPEPATEQAVTIVGGNIQVPHEQEPSGPMAMAEIQPTVFDLKQNHPNPFNPTTTIVYDVPTGEGHVTLRVYNVTGRVVRTLVNGPQSVGVKRVVWDAKDDRGNSVASGIYFYRMTAPGFEKTKKMVLLR